jgi:CheY-like chemotaxis protein
MPEIKAAVLIENDENDVLTAVDTLHSLGIDSITTFRSSLKAQKYLNEGIDGKIALPDLLIVDLDLQMESGYEILRYWRSTPALKRIPLMVWSQLGEDHEAVCEMFKITCFVQKWTGKEGLVDGIKAISTLN